MIPELGSSSYKPSSEYMEYLLNLWSIDRVLGLVCLACVFEEFNWTDSVRGEREEKISKSKANNNLDPPPPPPEKKEKLGSQRM